MVPTCAEGGVLGVLPATIGSIQATETLKLLLGLKSSLIGRILLYNALTLSFEFVELDKNPRCRVCGETPEITELIDYEGFCGVPSIGSHATGSAGPEWDITPVELQEQLQKSPAPLLLDVREPHELEISALPGAINIPLDDLPARLSELDLSRDIVILCKSGTRSTRALELLVEAGFRRVKNLKGGINAWAEEIDPDLPIY